MSILLTGARSVTGAAGGFYADLRAARAVAYGLLCPTLPHLRDMVIPELAVVLALLLRPQPFRQVEETTAGDPAITENNDRAD